LALASALTLTLTLTSQLALALASLSQNQISQIGIKVQNPKIKLNYLNVCVHSRSQDIVAFGHALVLLSLLSRLWLFLGIINSRRKALLLPL